MLGCVVSLTSSHLSGSTIRDVNTGGSVLCSNSSFSSLLSSPNTDADTNDGPPYLFLPHGEYTPDDFEYGKPLWFLSDAGDENSSVVLSNCHFTGAAYGTEMVLRFYAYPGTISILSCSFTDISTSSGSPVYIYESRQFNHTCVTVTSSNFTNCSTTRSGGGLYIQVADDILIQKCRFESCSALSSSSEGGGALFLFGFDTNRIPPKFNLVDCLITDCKSTGHGGGVFGRALSDLLIVDTKFAHCSVTTESRFIHGGGISTRMYFESGMTVERCYFIDCSSKFGGGAIESAYLNNLSISDTLVKECYSGSTGAILMTNIGAYANYSFSHVLFDGNTIGDDSTYYTDSCKFDASATKFTDLALFSNDWPNLPILKIDDCFTTITPDSTGMLLGLTRLPSGLYDPERKWDPEFNNIGPLLTAKATVSVNEKTGKLESEMKGKTPLTSQEYEVIVKDSDGTETETRLRMLFSDGTGTLVSVTKGSLEFNTSYTILSIVGVVPESSSSQMTNDVTVPVAAWAFNLAVTPSFLTFATPDTPSFSTLQVATPILVESDPQFAFVILYFDKEVSGSYDFVVLEEGEEVTLTISTETDSKSGGTKEFKVIGDGKLLTHDTTYTIESIVPTAESEAQFVWMNETIRFHIPKSSYDPKKSLSPETKKLLSWLIPLVACLLLALIVLIVVFVLVYRRKKKGEPAQKEMEGPDQVECDEKLEVLDDNLTKGLLHTERRTHSAFDSSVLPTNMNHSRDGLEGEAGKDCVEVMACSGDFEVSLAAASTTLYSVLHKEKREIGKRAIGVQLVNGLKAVLASRPASDVVTRLSSHWILIDGSGNVQLKLQMSSTEAEQEAAQTKRQGGMSEENGTVQNIRKDDEQFGMDGLRWRAPEVVAGGGSAVDGSKASVFSLGLVLWEIETGQVPFGELDAVNAQRQSATGIEPKMESLRNEEFIALILQCVSANAEQRPSLSEIGEFLSSHPEESHNQSHNELKDQTQ